jgi:uncharacterized NAD(P)/FAD-binding protein YdhS
MRPEPHLVDVLIIGGGASAVAVLAAIAKRSPDIRVALADKSPIVGVGVAYSTELEQHILNVPAQAMGIDVAQPGDFLDWTVKNGLSINPSDFVSRITYGRYLKDITKQVVTDRKLQIWQTEVTTLNKEGELFSACGADGKHISAKNVILALGHTALEWPIKKIIGEPRERLIINPWKLSGYEALDDVKNIAVLGTGLTAMDVVSALDGRGYRGQITLISRRGLLPCASHGDKQLKEVTLTQQTLGLSLRALMAWIRSEAESLNSTECDWRALIDAFRPHIPRIWRRFTLRERNQFLRYIRPYWEVVRHRMPSQVRARVDELRAEGKLHIIQGRVVELVAGSTGELTLKLQSVAGQSEITADRLFNCTGGAALRAAKLPNLLKSLQQQGLIMLSPFGLGVETGLNGELLNVQCDTVAGCYVIGPLRRASDWESTAMREIREQAQQIARLITDAR